MHILLAAAAAAVQQSMTRLLDKLGHQVVCASDGGEAHRLFARSQADLLVSDIRMPVMDGFALARILRAEGHRLPILFISAYTGQQTEKMLAAIGNCQLIPKPIELSRLMEAIKAVERSMACSDQEALPCPG